MIGTTEEIAEVYRGYVDALLWSESCYGTMDHEHSTNDPQDCDAGLDSEMCAEDLSPAAQLTIMQDVVNFLASAQDQRCTVFSGLSLSQIGHDFLLTRNGHGTGFWDRGLGERGDFLTAEAKVYGEISAYVSGGMVHL